MRKIIKDLIYGLSAGRLIRKGKPGAVYITYDDGPHPENTRVILDVLAQHQARATFFMVGECMEEYPQIVDDVIRAGHGIGYHSYQHKSLKKTGLLELRRELAGAKKIAGRFGFSLRLYRPPYGELSILSLLVLLLSGWKVVMWSLDSRDSYDSLQQVIENLDPAVISDGEIILLHDDTAAAGEMLDTALGRLRTNGFRFGLLQGH